MPHRVPDFLHCVTIQSSERKVKKKNFKKSVGAKLVPDLARDVCRSDDEVDALETEIVFQVGEAIKKRPEQVDRLLHYMFVARHLERIADHATNIAEDVIYMVTGEIIRHRTKLPDTQSRDADGV
jgi:phosphate transport system protein